MFSLGKFCLDPVGVVQNEAMGKEVRDKNLISKIIFREDLIGALEGVKEFSHVFVLFWLHEMSEEDRKILKVHPRGRRDLPLMGIFATRSPHRPNPIGLTRVKLIKIERHIMTVQGLDAFNGTPIIDIKPFDSWDTTKDFKVPKWWLNLEKERSIRSK